MNNKVGSTYVGLFASLGEPDNVPWLNTARTSRLRFEIQGLQQVALLGPGEHVLRGDFNLLDLSARVST